MNSLFVQVHTLISYPASLLNRDDVGFAKRIPFGGATRIRVSSQCLKRHWRKFEGDGGLTGLGVEGSVRSRHIFERLVFQPLLDEGIDRAVAEKAVATLMSILQKGQEEETGEAEAGEKESTEGGGKGMITSQPIVLGRPEIEFLLEEARHLCKKGGAKDTKALAKQLKGDREKNLKALGHAAGLDAALFGRMVTSDILAQGDGAVHVAHAFTVHEETAESDYFSVVDDLQEAEGQKGAAHINSSELSAGLFYGYVVVDVPQLVSNLEGCEQANWREADRGLAAKVMGGLTKVIATVTPGAKLGSTAPYAYAHMVFLEAGPQQPRTLANAFLRPVSQRSDVVANAYEALRSHLADLDTMYGPVQERAIAALGPTESLGDALQQANVKSLSALMDWAGARIRGA